MSSKQLEKDSVILSDGEDSMVRYREALQRMSRYAEQQGDGVQAGKLAELARKLEQDRLTIAFCGHFSAGKSTLVNALCGAELLPSSPIPTSANVVTIVNGEPAARMTFQPKQGDAGEPEQIPVEKLHSFAVEGEGVASIEVSYPIPLLGASIALVDTPGVDSTDGAHRAATESALHLADVVFYVTDYNHVLSDVNFRFLRSLDAWGKPTYLIVNQIDKHRESEVTFDRFRESIVTALEQWRIEPAGLLFLSLRNPDHPLSKWEELGPLIRKLEPLRNALTVASAERSAAHLAEAFRETLHARHSERREALERLLVPSGGAKSVQARRSALESRLHALLGEADERRNALRDELDKLLANASLTPAETRDKARDVLEAMQPGFKAGGWFGGGAKTDAERSRRLELLTDDLNRQAVANVSGHVRSLLRKLARETGAADEDETEMEASLEAAFPALTAEWVKARVKPGAGADGQATLTYAAELAADMKASYRKEALRWADSMMERGEPAREAEALRLQSELDSLRPQEEATAELEKLNREEQDGKDRLLAHLREAAPSASESAASSLPELPQPSRLTNEVGAEVSEPRSMANNETGEAFLETGVTSSKGGTARSDDFALNGSNEAARRLAEAASLLAQLPALQRLADNLAAKADRYCDSKFTIALFGAFSAGKSSFANALVGEQALPVSPNPTTATINRIVAPEEGRPHGTALVTMKAQDAMLADLAFSLKRLGVDSERIEKAGSDPKTLFALSNGLSPEEIHPRGRPHLAFLRAAEQGWNTYGPQLGNKFLTEYGEYRRYAADETASCFVAEIDLYVDSSLTRSGAVLVDTPGADSINARHTGVAFEYIKNADAVLFVTYYNHAFTEADRQFLQQLGSVKDAFELDKMFFVINAADLASSAEELRAVEDHVGTQLLKHGIRYPKLFPVSSLRGLEAKQAGDQAAIAASGLTAFELAFRQFAEVELGALAARAADKEIQRAGAQLESFARSAEQDGAARAERARRLLEEARLWRTNGPVVPDSAIQPLVQEMAEQLYHLRQRVYYRYGEHFQSAFHPSVLQDDGRDLKRLMQACGDDLLRSLSEDVASELRAAGLRIENTLIARVTEKMQSEAAKLAEEGFSPETPPRPELPFTIGDPFADRLRLDERKLWNAFRSPKHFFEKEGRTALREELESPIFEAVDRYLAQLRSDWQETLISAFRQALEQSAIKLAEELAAFAESVAEAMLRPGEEALLAQLLGQWKSISEPK